MYSKDCLPLGANVTSFNCNLSYFVILQKPPGIMCVLDDVCATMHAQGEGADMKLLQVCLST